MKRKILYPLILLFCFLFAQKTFANRSSDSLLLAYKNAASDTIRVKILHQLYLVNDSLPYAQRALEIAEKIKYPRGAAQALLDIGRWYYFSGKVDLSLDYLTRSVKVAEVLNEMGILKTCFRYIGFIYRPQEPFKAKKYYEKSLELCFKTGDEIGASYIYSAIGNVYEGNYDKSETSHKKALEYYLKSLKIREQKGSPSEIAASLNETSRVYEAMHTFDKALELRKKGLEIARSVNDRENTIFLLGTIGNDYCVRQNDHKSGLKYLLEAYSIGRTGLKNFILLADISRAIAKCYYESGNYKSSGEYFLKAEIYSDSIRNTEIRNSYNLSAVKQELENEIEKQKLLLKDAEILKEKAQSERQVVINRIYLIAIFFVLVLSLVIYLAYRQKQKANYDLDARNREVEIAYKTLAVSESKFKQITETINDVFYLYNIKEKRYEYISPNCLELFGLKPSFFYEGKSMKVIVHNDDRQAVINANVLVDSGLSYNIEYRILVNGDIKWVAEKSSPIFDEKGELVRNSGICRDITSKKRDEELLQKKNRDITNSINYARNIQSAMEVPIELIRNKVKEIFILAKPKEIVSGDFYFYKETQFGIYIAAVDCTGHGVPAGFLSMIGNSFLEDIIKNSMDLSPAEILNQLRDRIISSLHQDNPNTETKDGMDIAMLKFDKDLKSVQYSGAFNSLIHIRNGQLNEISADLFTVGLKFGQDMKAFSNHNIDLEKGDALYIMSDGYVSQFGGPNDRKFSKKQMLDLLLKIQPLNLDEQKKILDSEFETWKGKSSQVDDVLVIGIKV